MAQTHQKILSLPNRPFWYEESLERPALSGLVDADIAIVGAGYTGLWTAYYLLKRYPSLRVVILERQRVGFGASGRNGGWASAIFPISLSRVAQMYSHSAALSLQRAMNDTVDEIGRVLAEENIDADYVKSGFLSLARTKPQLERVAAAVESSTRFGLPEQWQAIGAADAADKVGADNVLGGLYTPHCALVHPGKLVRGLAHVVEKMGATIYEQSPVISIAQGHVQTANGAVQAETIVRATEAFTCQQQDQRRSVIPLYSLVLATEPLSAEQQRATRLEQRMAFNDMRHLRIYGQMTASGRLIFGGRGAPYHFGSRITDKDDLVDGVHTKIYDTLLELFPQLDELSITHRWGGALGVSRDWCPTVSFDPAKRIGWAGNYVGDGVATSNLAGRILSNLIFNHDEEINRLPLVNHHSPIWEPEPFRWLGINSGLFAAGLSDFEERLTNKPSRAAHLLEKLTGAH
ncbi:NAD(P)/FAD-dependent oxidoreductase [Pantoea rwandensis]|uniref:FAD-dependent oxidoreductase n=1 Tax=Pantoea rwandensis TaxID=1076550 RepID=A0A1X1D636_9GAMM|nr:FAD-dependent oxidoreductase [Pantoea rwandensis]ORM72114.1 FAD-dependent oxidoreductase [Pantoea rwandensis]